MTSFLCGCPDTTPLFLQNNQGGGLRLGPRWEVSVTLCFHISHKQPKTASKSKSDIQRCFAEKTLVTPCAMALLRCVRWHLFFILFSHLFPSHDFIGDFTTSYRELARGQSQFNVYEVRHFSSISVGSWSLQALCGRYLHPIFHTADISIIHLL